MDRSHGSHDSYNDFLTGALDTLGVLNYLNVVVGFNENA